MVVITKKKIAQMKLTNTNERGRMNKDINYCTKCGKQLYREELDKGFDLLTGERDYIVRWFCPKTMELWSFSHTELFSDKDGSTYSFEI